ncbi:hypothetical protein ACYOEI_03380 [Singulisphaera rosea]
MESEELAMQLWGWAMGFGVTAVVVPLIVARFNSRWGAGVAVALSTVATALEYVSNGYMPRRVDIRADIVLIGPLLLIAWGSCLSLLVSAAFRKAPNKP